MPVSKNYVGTPVTIYGGTLREPSAKLPWISAIDGNVSQNRLSGGSLNATYGMI